MKTKKFLLWIFTVCSAALALPPAASAVPAFPGAEGGGATSVGGRGGQVIEVSNLGDSGTGSLRACVMASGPRTCVFLVGGTIELASQMYITNPFLTVAGQTAPGGGILISGKNVTNGLIQIDANDVIWRYTRIRVGFLNSTEHSRSCMHLWKARIIVDHNSCSWNSDEGLSASTYTGANAKDVTLSWNLVGEGLEGHATSLLSSSISAALADSLTNVDFHHNLTLNNTHRAPLMRSKSIRLVNNIFYNIGNHITHMTGGVQTDIIGNKYKRGPYNPANPHEIQAGVGIPESPTGDPSIYLSGNIGPNQSDAAGDQWLMARQICCSDNGSEVGDIPAAWRRASPLPNTTYPIASEPVANLDTTILPTVGASRRLACDGSWAAARDSVDTRLVNQYQTDTGNSVIIANENQVGGFPSIAGGTPCTDTDHDGMPDVWETTTGLNPNDAADRNNLAPSGFTWLEEFLEGETEVIIPTVLNISINES